MTKVVLRKNGTCLYIDGGDDDGGGDGNDGDGDMGLPIVNPLNFHHDHQCMTLKTK